MSQKVYGKFTSSRALYFDVVSFLEYNNFTISITAHSEAGFGRLRAWNHPSWRSNDTNIQATYGTDDIIISFFAYD